MKELVIDPAWFAPEAVRPEVLAFNEAMRANPGPSLAEVGVEAMRKAGGRPKPPLSPRAEVRSIPGPNGAKLPLRVIAPDNPRGAYLHFHGGGLIFGTADAQDPMLEAIAEATGLAAISVDYRLAPEHPWPAAWDDAEAAALWLAEHVAAEFGGDRLAIGGESAGATLAVPTLVRLRDRHGFTGFHAAALTYGNYDTSGSPSNKLNGSPGLLIGAADVAYCSSCYAPDPATRRDPDMSAIFADVSGLPPALFTVGTLDVFLDDSLFMATRWIAAGNEAELAVYPGAMHGFTLFPHPLAGEALARIEDFLRVRTSG
ncbi:MAG: alpha/beta hydrolase fold domain-containing protein [Sphingomonadaceae bacterium]|nr:alpha/beta hydrolase fold domain-containing protein [Sphingomonadaceae bacterium]